MSYFFEKLKSFLKKIFQPIFYKKKFDLKMDIFFEKKIKT